MRVRSPMRSPEGGRDPPRVSHNLFFALRPDERVRDRIADVARDLKRDHEPAGRWIKAHRYHMTLRFLGTHARVPDDLVADAFAAGDRVSISAFEFALDRAGSFANPSVPWWVGCREMAPELTALWDAISAGLEGIRGEAHRVPHVTILRNADRRLSPTPIEPIPWPVGEFVPIDSALGPEPTYTVLRRWRLSGGRSDMAR